MGLILSQRGGRTLSYRAQGINFDGSSAYLLHSDVMAGQSDGKLGLVSGWMRRAATGSNHSMIYSQGQRTAVRFDSSDRLEIITREPVTGIGLQLVTTDTYTSTSTWYHILASWDLASATYHLYVNDAVPSAMTTETLNNVDQGYGANANNWAVGAQPNAGGKMNGDLADILWWHDKLLDLSSSANRRLFINASGKPVNPRVAIESQGAPDIGMYGTLAAWEVNKGTGGGFTENGTITAAATSPSD